MIFYVIIDIMKHRFYKFTFSPLISYCCIQNDYGYGIFLMLLVNDPLDFPLFYSHKLYMNNFAYIVYYVYKYVYV